MKDKKAQEAWEIMDAFAETTEYLAGYRNQLVAQGFSEDQAGEIVVLTFRHALLAQYKALDNPDI